MVCARTARPQIGGFYFKERKSYRAICIRLDEEKSRCISITSRYHSCGSYSECDTKLLKYERVFKKMKLIKVVKKETFTTKKGTEKHKSYYAIEIDNGNLIVINPVFKDGYSQLDLIAEKRFENNDEK